MGKDIKTPLYVNIKYSLKYTIGYKWYMNIELGDKYPVDGSLFTINQNLNLLR